MSAGHAPHPGFTPNHNSRADYKAAFPAMRAGNAAQIFQRTLVDKSTPGERVLVNKTALGNSPLELLGVIVKGSGIEAQHRARPLTVHLRILAEEPGYEFRDGGCTFL
jgi:hypothetical protein